MAEKYTLTQGAVQWLVDKLKGSAQKQDVLTYEEIQASTDLSGKIASASALKDVGDIVNLYLTVPNDASINKNHIIANCKYLSSIIEPNKPRFMLIEKHGKAMVIGYTYEKSNDPNYAFYIYGNTA